MLTPTGPAGGLGFTATSSAPSSTAPPSRVSRTRTVWVPAVANVVWSVADAPPSVS